MDKINEQEEGYPLRFVNAKESVWMIARAYYKLLSIYLRNKGLQPEEAVK
ncbi:hypothetical protein [Effusibacillus consociatus]|uniref:Transposase n=1 Tax=Effusibacillus consociatus TaxID=1117041 RepID=A0ABV9PYC1_9BACL